MSEMVDVVFYWLDANGQERHGWPVATTREAAQEVCDAANQRMPALQQRYEVVDDTRS